MLEPIASHHGGANRAFKCSKKKITLMKAFLRLESLNFNHEVVG